MKQTAATFDWDYAIALFKGVDQPKCRKGLHVMTAENSYVNANSGHHRCRACIRDANRQKRLRQRMAANVDVSPPPVKQRSALSTYTSGPPGDAVKTSQAVHSGPTSTSVESPKNLPPLRLTDSDQRREVVAKAIWQALFLDPGKDYDWAYGPDDGQWGRDAFRRMAQAAIDAMA